MGLSVKGLTAIILACFVVADGFFLVVNGGIFDYNDALTKSLIFLEAQRSGKLPPNGRLKWRGDSALTDGKDVGTDLSGGYYDAGDNVKYGLPMAFTITTLSWNAIFYQAELQSTGELQNVYAGIRWGTDYFLKCSIRKNLLWVQAGDPTLDHQCWIRPENMNTPRTCLKIDTSTPGTEIAAETAAAMAAASVVFRPTDHVYSRQLLNKAKLLFEFAKASKGTFDGECPFYCSYSGFNDELLWAASWLYVATRKAEYLQYIQEEAITANVAEFSWDLKYAGVNVLLAKLFLEGEKSFDRYKKQADNYICSALPESPFSQVTVTLGGLLHLRDGANTQYVTSSAFLFSIYSDILTKYNLQVTCGSATFTAAQLLAYAQKQIDYLLGSNPQSRSYMVGFGKNPPQQAHHRGASVPVLAPNTVVSCPQTFTDWFSKNAPNPNELTGAIVGGPDKNDNFIDSRANSSYTEPCTYVNTCAVGILAKLASHKI